VSATTKELRAPSLLAEIGAGRLAAFAALLIVAVALQTTVLKSITLLGVQPGLVLVVVVSLALLDGPKVGVVTGFAGGLLLDLLLPPQAILGLTAMVYVFVGYIVGQVREMAPEGSVWAPVLSVAAASAATEASYAILSILLGQTWVGLLLTAKIIGLVVLYNTLLTPFVFPAVRRVAGRFRPERVVRW
jgi:rod shape-determining protein MreD